MSYKLGNVISETARKRQYRNCTETCETAWKHTTLHGNVIRETTRKLHKRNCTETYETVGNDLIVKTKANDL
jgi:hypothetical protein